MKHLSVALLVVALLLPSGAAQAPAATARIHGRVVAAATGLPLVRATVTLQPIGNVQSRRVVKTDANGNYVIADLRAGRYGFVVTRAGYLDQNFDQPHPLARYRLLELGEGEQLDGINFSLQRGAAITGVITDDAGDPLPEVRVVALREEFGVNGRWFRAESRTADLIQTDDEGRYRVYGLRPGTYVVAASTQAMDSHLDFGRTYYPGAVDESEAHTVRVDIGVDGVANFSMIPAKRARVTGVALDSQGRAASRWRYMLYERRGPRFEPIGGDTLKEDGRFEMDRVLPGRYMLQIRPPYTRERISQANAESATIPLDLNGEDISGLVITTSGGHAVSGGVTFEGAASTPATKGMRVSAREIEAVIQPVSYAPGLDNGLVDQAGRFTIRGVRGRVRIGGGGSGWFTKRVLLKGVDVTASGFDVTGDIDGIEVILTNRVTTVTGTARDARGIGRNDFIVAFFPIGQIESYDRASRQRTIRPDPDGVYRIRNLPAGDYIAAAVPAMSLPLDGEWDPAFLEKIKPRATGFKLSEGQTLALNLTLIE